MVNAVRQKKTRKRLLFFVGLPVILLAAAGGVLQSLSLSLQDISTSTRLSVGKMSAPAEAVVPLESILRGTIYSRDFKELSVSYQLWSIYAHSSALSNRLETAAQLSRVLHIDEAVLARRLKNVQQVIEVAEDIDKEQAAEVEALQLDGIYCKTVEKRYHPFHTLSANFLGFTSNNKGMIGTEALYDSVLQPGIFRSFDLEEVDFEGQEVLGRKSTDVILTIDLDLQKQLEQELEAYREQRGAARGIGLAMDPGSGRVLAMVSQPDFNPNYFWKAESSGLQDPVFTPLFNRKLLQPLQVMASIIHDAGLGGTILPETVMAPNNGLSEEQLNEYWNTFGLCQSVQCQIAASSQQTIPGIDQTTGLSGLSSAGLSSTRLSGAQIGVGLASLINSGNRVSPYFLHSIYDHAEGRFYNRNPSVSTRRRVIKEPAAGINLRRQLLHSRYGSEEGFMFVNNSTEVVDHNGLSEHLIQEVLLAAVPRKTPKIMLMMAVDYGTLYPMPPVADESEEEQEDLASIGQRLLPVLTEYMNREYADVHPVEKNQKNYRRFFISKRLKPPEQKEHNNLPLDSIMPDVIGLSLRKGLQLINAYDLKVSIRGSGRIVAQNPASGEPIAVADNCELTLESSI